MAKKRYISDSFWSDSWIEELNPLEKYLFLYLLSNQLVSICGFYEIPLKRIAYETGIDKDMVLKMITRFEEFKKVYYNDGIICIVNFVKNQNIRTKEDNLWKGIEREVKDFGKEKMASILLYKGLTRTLQGAYKDLDIPYLTLLNLTLLNSTNIVSKETTDLEKSDTTLVKIKKEKNPEIDNLIQELKTQADILGIAYDKKDERNFGKHILTAKEFGNFCEKIGQERIEFAKNIMIASEKIKFWKGTCAGPMLIYQNYAEVYNLTKTKSEASKIVKIETLDW